MSKDLEQKKPETGLCQLRNKLSFHLLYHNISKMFSWYNLLQHKGENAVYQCSTISKNLAHLILYHFRICLQLRTIWSHFTVHYLKFCHQDLVAFYICDLGKV